MQISGCPTRDDRVVWKNVGDEIVIVEIAGTIRILNETAGFIWTMADGIRKVEDIIPEVCDRFDVTSEQAKSDILEFCQELLRSGLISLRNDDH